MIDLRTLHSMLIEMHGGMLTLATICIFAMVVRAFHQRMRRKNEWYVIFEILDGFFEKIAKYVEPTSYLASIGGLIGLVVSSIVGYYAWPVEVIMGSPLVVNKIMMAIFSTEFWAIFVLVRAKYGESLWKNDRLVIVYVCTGFAGFFFMVLTGSLGGHMVGIHAPSRGSLLDPVYDLLGIRPDIPWIIRADMVPFVTLTASIWIIALFLLYLRAR